MISLAFLAFLKNRNNQGGLCSKGAFPGSRNIGPFSFTTFIFSSTYQPTVDENSTIMRGKRRMYRLNSRGWAAPSVAETTPEQRNCEGHSPRADSRWRQVLLVVTESYKAKRFKETAPVGMRGKRQPQAHTRAATILSRTATSSSNKCFFVTNRIEIIYGPTNPPRPLASGV